MKRGDVVLIDFPFSDRTGSKLRPALVVQDDAVTAARDDVILAAISRTQRFPNTEVVIDPSTPEGQRTGLRQMSAVDCALLGTFDQMLIKHTLGSVSTSLMELIDGRLQVALGFVK